MAERELDRRSLLGRFVPEAAQHVAKGIHGELVRLTPRRRPPGAVEEPLFLELCTRCEACVDACPELSIHLLAGAAGIGAGTPVMLPDRRACRMCAGFPCIAACEDGALLMPELPVWKLGSVRVVPSRCLPFMGPECGACRDLCPTEAPALRLKLARPEIDDDACVGCGLCIAACPTDPPAIELLPLE